MLFAYATRNLIARRGSIAPTVIAVAAAVGIATALLALMEGLRATMADTGDPRNVIVTERGAQGPLSGAIPLSALASIELAPGAQRSGDKALVSAEYLATVGVRNQDGVSRSGVVFRGVEPIAFEVHDGVRLVRGAFPTRNQPGVIVGAARFGKHLDLVDGGMVRVGRERWPILGVLSAPGTQYDAEVWCDRSALLHARHQQKFTSASVKLERPDALAGFAAAIEKIPTVPSLTAQSERAFYEQSAGGAALYLDAIFVVIAILGLGAVFACMGAMYTAFLGRVRELATLRAIGYRRGSLALLVLLESMLVALLGGALGLALAQLARGVSVNVGLEVGGNPLEVISAARMSARVMASGAAVAMAIGLLGGLAPLVYAVRLDVLKALRD